MRWLWVSNSASDQIISYPSWIFPSWLLVLKLFGGKYLFSLWGISMSGCMVVSYLWHASFPLIPIYIYYFWSANIATLVTKIKILMEHLDLMLSLSPFLQIACWEVLKNAFKLGIQGAWQLASVVKFLISLNNVKGFLGKGNWQPWYYVINWFKENGTFCDIMTFRTTGLSCLMETINSLEICNRVLSSLF